MANMPKWPILVCVDGQIIPMGNICKWPVYLNGQYM